MKCRRRKLTLPVTADQTFKVLSSEPLTIRLPQNCRHVITWSSCPFSTYNTDVHIRDTLTPRKEDGANSSNRNAQSTSRTKIYTQCEVSSWADESRIKHFISIFYYLYMRHQLLKSVGKPHQDGLNANVFYTIYFIFSNKRICTSAVQF